MLNHMLDDGLPYRVIIDELGEAGEGLNTQNITNWVKSGYQDYLKHQDAIDRAKAQVELAIDLLREIGETDIAHVRRACNYVAALQLLEAMREHGDDALKNMFQATPAKYLQVVHALCHQSNSAVKAEKHRLSQELLAARSSPAALPSNQIKVDQAPAEISAELQPATNPIIHPSTNPSALPSSQIKVDQARAEISAQLTPPPIPNARCRQ
ncbi:MAG TPA: hypothetical protein VN578_12920 [Candidatus Binatia bacterium]|nr:hypothetical protein [Candidatus Binatia bacterium]